LLLVGDAVNLALDCLFPQQCVGCGRMGSFICYDCSAHLPFLHPPLCPHCGQPQMSGILCANCAGRTSSVLFIRSAFRFEGTVRQAVHELKYRNVRAIGPLLASYIAPVLREAAYAPDLIVPVPMHPRRKRRRGYNQADILARSVGKLVSVEARTDVVQRSRDGASQLESGTSARRRSNVHGAFACANRLVSGKRVLLVDDVCTTGATIEACATALRSAGAAEVAAVTVAREV